MMNRRGTGNVKGLGRPPRAVLLGELIDDCPLIVGPAARISDVAAQFLAQPRVQIAVVVDDDGSVAGLLSRRRLGDAAEVSPNLWCGRVAEWMQHGVPAWPADRQLKATDVAALGLVSDYVVVLEAGTVAGTVSVPRLKRQPLAETVRAARRHRPSGALGERGGRKRGSDRPVRHLASVTSPTPR